jgi:hypothetical protein
MWLKSMLSDNTDSVSSKRVITFLSFLLCAAAFIADLGWDLKVDFPVFQSMMYIVIAGLGFTASEKFANK